MMDKLNEPGWWQPPFFAAMSLFFAWAVWKAFKTGRTSLNQYVYDRDKQPKRFWFATGLWGTASLGCAYATIGSLLTLMPS